MIRRLATISLIAVVLVFCSSPGVNYLVSAASNGGIVLNNGYFKGQEKYDIVVKANPKDKLAMYVNDKSPSKATANKKGWATFKGVYLRDSGKLSFTHVYYSKGKSYEKPINYTRYFVINNSQIRFVATDVTKTAVIGQRTKTTACVVDANRQQDKACTPGAVFANVTKEMVCKSGYSKSVRNVSSSTKQAVYAEYGITSHTSGEYEVDHLVSLELGGSNSISNLWPEAANPTPGFHEKDKVENKLHAEVCSGAISLADAQQKIANDWLSVYIGMFPPAPAAKSVAPPHVTYIAPKAKTAPAPATTPSSAGGVIKKSSTGICHAPGTTYYERTTHYTAYDTIDDCLASGGRLPLR